MRDRRCHVHQAKYERSRDWIARELGDVEVRNAALDGLAGVSHAGVDYGPAPGYERGNGYFVDRGTLMLDTLRHVPVESLDRDG